MLENLIGWLAASIVAVISGLGYGGILLLMALESACLPLPSEIIMPFAGYLASTGRFDLWLVATVGAVGCNLGSAFAYAVGQHGGRRMILRWGAYLLIDPVDLDRADRFFHRYGGATVFVSRMLPVIRTFIALPAGIAGMPLLKFHLFTFFGSWPWCFALAYVGYRLGRQWDRSPALRDFMHRFDVVIVAAMVLLVGWHIWRHWRHSRGPTPPC